MQSGACCTSSSLGDKLVTSSSGRGVQAAKAQHIFSSILKPKHMQLQAQLLSLQVLSKVWCLPAK